MRSNRWWTKLLRFLAVILMGLTAAYTVLSGAGTSCVALAAEKYRSKMASVVPYEWLYLVFVLVTIVIGILGLRATSLLI